MTESLNLDTEGVTELPLGAMTNAREFKYTGTIGGTTPTLVATVELFGARPQVNAQFVAGAGDDLTLASYVRYHSQGSQTSLVAGSATVAASNSVFKNFEVAGCYSLDWYMNASGTSGNTFEIYGMATDNAVGETIATIGSISGNVGILDSSDVRVDPATNNIFDTASTPGDFVSVGTVSTTVLAANSSRQYAAIVNQGTCTVSLTFGTTAVEGAGILLFGQGSSLEITTANLYRGEISAIITEDGTCDVGIIEA